MPTIMMELNQHQYRLLQDLRQRGYGSSDTEIVHSILALCESERSSVVRQPKPKRPLPAGRGRRMISRLVLAPGTGEAVELPKYHALRIEQIEDGGQCVDLNVYNIHDYRECFSAGRTRGLHGLHPSRGDKLWSAPPRERALLTITDDTCGTNDVAYARCSGFIYELNAYQEDHPNCHDIFSETIGAYGLTPDDVHDSFNVFMNTSVDQSGQPYIARLKVHKGDYVEFLAHIDLLCAMVACPSDIFPTSNHRIKSVGLTVFSGDSEDRAYVDAEPAFVNQRTASSFSVRDIRTDRELRRNPDYRPDFSRSRLDVAEVRVDVSEADRRTLVELRAEGGLGETDAETLRFVLLGHWLNRYARWI